MNDTYTEKGQKFYASTGMPVWPGRFRQLPDMRTGQPKGLLLDEDIVRHALDRLDELERKTRPIDGPATEKSKDLSAFSALHAAARLLKYLTQWAIDHQIGLAMNNLRFVPLFPSQTKRLPEYKAARDAVDVHDHERVGGTFSEHHAAPETARKAAINILSPIAGTLNLGSLLEALKALETGEVLPILEPVKTDDKTRYTEARFQLQAVSLVAYWTSLKRGKRQAQERVAAAFGVSAHTLRGWEPSLRERLGTIEVNAAISRAQNYAATFEEEDQRRKLGDKYAHPEDFDFSFGTQSADEVGKRYKAFVGFSA